MFVCYAHADSSTVYPELEWLRDQGFNIWYDEGISAGADWRDEVANYIEGGELYLFFLSPSSAVSGDCLRELNYAIDQNKPLVISELQRTELRGGLKLSISPVQAVRRYELGEAEYRRRLLAGLRRHMKHSIRRLTDQTIVVSDLRQFGAFSRSAPTEALEDLLVHYENLWSDACHRFGGTPRSTDGDSYRLTFENPSAGIAAIQEFASRWLDYIEERKFPTHVAMGVTLGSFQVFRSFSFGRSLDFAGGLCGLAKLLPELKTRAILSERVVARLNPDLICSEIAPESYIGTTSSTSDARRDPLTFKDFLESHKTYELELNR